MFDARTALVAVGALASIAGLSKLASGESRSASETKGDPGKLLGATLDLLRNAELSDRYAAIGGVAVRAYVPTREVRDVDLLVDSMDSIDKLRSTVRSQKTGFQINESHIPKLSHEHGQVDVIPAEYDLVWQEAFDSRRPRNVLGHDVQVPSREALVKMKLQAAREDPTQRQKSLRDLRALAYERG